MIRKNFKGATCAFIIGFLVSLSAIAFAIEVASAWKPINGYQYAYRNQAKCIYDANGIYGYTWVDARGTTVPAGYMGAQAFLYNSSGTCVAVSSTKYTTYDTTYLAQATAHYTTYGTYHSDGLTYIWNPTAGRYDPYSTYQTPNLIY